MRLYSWYTALLSVVLLLVWHDLTSAEEAEEEEIQETKELSRERRSFVRLGTFLGLAAVGVTSFSIGYDVFLSNKGCCKMHNVCRKQDQIKYMKVNWETKTKEMNKEALKVSLNTTHILSMHHNNEVIRIRLMQIIDLIDKLVKILTDEDVNALKIMQEEIDQLRRENTDKLATWTIDDVKLKYPGLWGTPKGMLHLFAPLMFELGTHGLSKIYQGYKMRKLRSALGEELTNSIIRNSKTRSKGKVALKILGRPNFDNKAFIKQTAKSKYQGMQASRGKLRKSIGHAFSLLTIGLETWMNIEKTKTCAKVSKEIKSLYKLLKNETAQLADRMELVKESNKQIAEAYKFLSDSISSVDFLDGIRMIRNLVTDASTQTDKSKLASEQFQYFLSSIEGAVKIGNTTQITQLQKILVLALESVQYTYQCYLKKAESIDYIKGNCKSGSGTLEALYGETYKKMMSCAIDKDANAKVYLSLEKVQEAIKIDAEENNYFYNCLLNNEYKKKLVCKVVCDETISRVAKDNDMTESEVGMLCADTRCTFGSREKKYICYDIKDGKATFESLMAEFGEPFRKSVQEVWDECKK